MATTTNTATETMLMNPTTGSVASLEEWKADFADIAPEERPEVWGGQKFEDGGLIEVIWDEEANDWREAE